MRKLRNLEEKKNPAPELRDRAEDKLARPPGTSLKINEKNLAEIVHELQVHQIELEMQNEELRRTQLTLEESRSKYIDLYDFAPVGYFTLTDKSLIAEVNLMGAHLLGVARRKLTEGRFRRFVAPEDQRLWDHHLLSVLKGEEKQTCDLLLRRADGSTFPAHLESVRLAAGDSAPVVRTIVSDITERRQAEQTLAEDAAKLEATNQKLESLSHSLKKASEELEAKVTERTAALNEVTQRLKLAIASGRIGIWDRDVQSGAMVWNDRMFEIYGLAKESVTPSFDVWQRCLHPDDCERVMETNRAAISGEQEFDIEYRILHPDGTVKWVKADARVIRDADGKPLRIVGTNLDVSERKLNEIKIQSSLREKETLLKEIHHRVKNNMQIISSMLSMQAAHVGDEKVAYALKESQNRIRAMAAVHLMLYKSENFAEINFGMYAHDMVKQLVCSYGMNSGAISVSISAENVLLSIETAVPCCLIINELVSNALKHAFPENRKGEIRIELDQVGSDIRILFEDNGIGFPEDINFRDTSTLGLDLVNLLVEQLDGTIELHRGEGTRYAITLKRGEPQNF